MLTTKEAIEVEKYQDLASVKKWDFTPTGILTLQIDAYCTGGLRKKWKDNQKKSLETMLNAFIIGAIKVADILHHDRLKKEEEKRIHNEELRRLQEEEDLRLAEEGRIKNLETQAELWTKSQQLRAYIQAVEIEAASRSQTAEFQNDLKQWLTWARQYAERLDPLHGGMPF